MSESTRVNLVSCVSKKKLTAAPSREFYVSPWFVAARRYVEATGDPWYVLSAKYGLVSPTIGSVRSAIVSACNGLDFGTTTMLMKGTILSS
jgi:hypothetical protein